jgi:hypothetical protein
MTAASGADLYDAAAVDPRILSTYDVIGLGSGIYFGRPHRTIRDLVDKLPAETKNVFLFSTSGLPFCGCVWHRGLRRTLRRKGYRVLGEFNCRGWDTVGPLRWVGGLNRCHPDRADLARAEDFVRGLIPNRPSPQPTGDERRGEP